MMVPGSHIGHQKMVLIRCSKILLVASVALFTTLVVFNNITDYGSNYAFVEHVLRMDTTFPNNKGMWRAITSPTLHHAAYRTLARIRVKNSRIANISWCLPISSLVNTSTQQAEAHSFNNLETRLPKGFSKRWGSNLVLLRSGPSVYVKKISRDIIGLRDP
jgi:predicted small integral membrane protein